MTPEEMEAVVTQIGSRLDLLDKTLKGAGIGVPMTLAFQCGHSGLYFPPDYLKEYGRKYGIGLGPTVGMSECLNSDYDSDLPPITPDIERIEQIMHPLYHVGVPVHLVSVPQAQYDGNTAVLAAEDPGMRKRAAIVYQKQVANSPKVQMIRAAWLQAGKQVTA